MDFQEKAESLRGKIIIFEGLPAAGKSTICDDLAEYLNKHEIPTKVYIEPVYDDLIEVVLTGIKKYAYAYQMYRLAQRQAIRTSAQVWAQEGYCCIIDGSMLSAFCFAQFHKNQGNFGDLELSEERWDNFNKSFWSMQFDSPYRTIFLDISPITSFDRSSKRGNIEANTMHLQFLINLSLTYNEFMSETCESPESLTPNLIEIDWSLSIDNARDRVAKILGSL